MCISYVGMCTYMQVLMRARGGCQMSLGWRYKKLAATWYVY